MSAEQEHSLRICSVCGARGVEMTDRPLDLGPEGGPPNMVEPGFLYEHCTVCDESLLPAEHLDDLFRKAVAQVQEREGMFSAADIREVRLSLGLTQSALARLLGADTKTISRWEGGTVKQNRTADTLLRLLAAHPELIAETGFVAAEGRGPYGRKPKADS